MCSAAALDHWQVIKKMRSALRTRHCVAVVLDDKAAACWTLAPPREHFTMHYYIITMYYSWLGMEPQRVPVKIDKQAIIK